MKSLIFVMAVLFFGGASPFLSDPGELIIIKIDDKEVMVKPVVEGHLNLYLSTISENRKVFGPQYRKTKTQKVVRYYLKAGDEIEKITPFNYKKVIKAYLPEAGHLHSELGKIGFRYENVPYMVNFYNDFITSTVNN